MRKIADGTEVTENQNRIVARERQVAVLDWLVAEGLSEEATVELRIEWHEEASHPCCCKGYKLLLSLCCVEFHCVNIP